MPYIITEKVLPGNLQCKGVLTNKYCSKQTTYFLASSTPKVITQSTRKSLITNLYTEDPT